MLTWTTLRVTSLGFSNSQGHLAKAFLSRSKVSHSLSLSRNPLSKIRVLLSSSLWFESETFKFFDCNDCNYFFLENNNSFFDKNSFFYNCNFKKYFVWVFVKSGVGVRSRHGNRAQGSNGRGENRSLWRWWRVRRVWNQPRSVTFFPLDFFFPIFLLFFALNFTRWFS